MVPEPGRLGLDRPGPRPGLITGPDVLGQAPQPVRVLGLVGAVVQHVCLGDEPARVFESAVILGLPGVPVVPDRPVLPGLPVFTGLPVIAHLSDHLLPALIPLVHIIECL